MLGILILLLTVESYAFEVVRKKDKIIVKDLPCAEMPQMLTSLQQWTLRMEDRNCSLPKQTTEAGGNCSADITKCVPAHVKKYHAKPAEFSNPNCYNLALVMSQLIPALRFTDEREFATVMASPFCTVLTETQSPEPGDILTLRFPAEAARYQNPILQETHAMIYVSENLVYSKNGKAPSKPFALQSLKPVLAEFTKQSVSRCAESDRDAEKVTNLHLKEERPLLCLDAIRCTPMRQFQEQLTDDSLKDLLDLQTNLDRIDCAMEKSFEKGHGTIDRTSARNLKDLYSGLLAYVEKNAPTLKEAKNDTSRAALFSMIKARLQSMSTTIQEIHHPTPTSIMFDANGKPYDANPPVHSAHQEAALDHMQNIVTKALAELGTRFEAGRYEEHCDEENGCIHYNLGDQPAQPVSVILPTPEERDLYRARQLKKKECDKARDEWMKNPKGSFGCSW